MIETRNISFSYQGSNNFNFPNLKVDAGASLLLLGNSGTGKTTLLHILAGLLPPQKGEVIVDGQSIYQLNSSKLDMFRGDHISVIFQKPHFIQSINVKENLLYAQGFSRTKRNGKQVEQILDDLQIGHLKNASTYTLSQGEQQRLSIARALSNEPKVILADEPTSALDDKNCDIVYNMLNQQAKNVGAALIIVTHDQRLKDLIPNRVNI